MAQIVLDGPHEKKWAGEVIAKCAVDESELIKMMENPNQYFKDEYIKAFGSDDAAKWDNALIVPHVNSESVMNISIPYKGFMPFNDPYQKHPHPPYYNYPKHPDGYCKDQPNHMDPAADQDEAYWFRVGDYVFAQCGD